MSTNENSNTAMATLNQACEKKPFQSFKNLPVGEYIVNHFSRVQTSYGERIQIDLNDTYMLLPERFSKLLDQHQLDTLNKSPKIMIFSGKDSTAKERLILEFRDSSYYAETLNFDID